ncbi:MAG: hypothetical protein DWP97_02015 [Calditrichaeota bacterium]|nr:MAG: hypothetical protein DWP97_02015 [Calditrichota bacterium]
MKRYLLLTVFGLLSLGLTIIGCDSSDSSNESNPLIGDTSSENFQFVQDEVGEGAFNTIGYSLDLSFDFIDQIPGAPTSPKQKNLVSYSASDSVQSNHQYTYDTLNGWHIFQFEATIYEDTDVISIAGTDSIQVTIDGDPMRYPDSTMNGIKIRNWFEFDVNSDDDAHGEGHHSYDIDATQYEVDGTGSIDGMTEEYLSVYTADSNATCTLLVENNVTINDVILMVDSPDDGCPQSGSVVVSSGLSLNCTGNGEGGLSSLSIDGTWTMTAQFNGTSETYTFSDGTTTWTITEPCDDPQTISSPFKGIRFNK